MAKISLILPTFVLFQLLIGSASCGKCTSVLNRNEIHEVTQKEPCVQKYEARCGWLSLNYCTFYRQTMCDKKKNVTVTIYYHLTECCKGYYEAKNGTCIKKQPGVYYKVDPTPHPIPVSVDPNFVEDVPLQQKGPEKKTEVSGGAYAGIACGLVLIITITVFIVIAIQKRKKKKKAVEKDPAQQVLYIGPSSAANQSVNRSIIGARIQGSNEHSREATPSSSRMVTPPTSPAKTEEVRFLVTQETADNLPETDI